MGRPTTVSFVDLRARYPNADLHGFEPTHHVQVLSIEDEVCREDYARLEEGDGPVRYAFVPGEREPAYGVLATGLWQCFLVHGRVKTREVRYRAAYVPFSELTGFVYFIQSGENGPIKIGWSQDVVRRMAELQTANAHALALLGTFAGTMRDEAETHTKFAHLRMEAEWFRNSPEIHTFLRDRR